MVQNIPELIASQACFHSTGCVQERAHYINICLVSNKCLRNEAHQCITFSAITTTLSLSEI